MENNEKQVISPASMRKKFVDGVYWLGEWKKIVDELFPNASDDQKINMIGVCYGGFANRHLSDQAYYFNEKNARESSAYKGN
jgi:hypothetical protein